MNRKELIKYKVASLLFPNKKSKSFMGKVASRLMEKRARAGHPANIELARMVRPGLFPGLNDGSPVKFEDELSRKLFEEKIDKDTAQSFQTQKRASDKSQESKKPYLLSKIDPPGHLAKDFKISEYFMKRLRRHQTKPASAGLTRPKPPEDYTPKAKLPPSVPSIKEGNERGNKEDAVTKKLKQTQKARGKAEIKAYEEGRQSFQKARSKSDAISDRGPKHEANVEAARKDLWDTREERRSFHNFIRDFKNRKNK